jgi:hypothetical protein
MMMGLRFVHQEGPTIRMPNRINDGLRARFIAPYRDGVFISVREKTGNEDTSFVTEGYYFDGADRKVHRVQTRNIRNSYLRCRWWNTMVCRHQERSERVARNRR